jgi:hypothetical protein
MTEEDQKLVALAALHGAKFSRKPNNGYWIADGQDWDGGMYTIGRAAERYLWEHELRGDAEHIEYKGRTSRDLWSPQDIDSAWVERVLA